MLVYCNLYGKKFNYYHLKNDFKNIVKAIFNLTKKKITKELSIVFVCNKVGQEINYKYRGKNYVPDVLAYGFEQIPNKKDVQSQLLGEIIIVVDKAKNQAQKYNHSQRREFCFLFTHGLLHLLGYNHNNLENEKIMFALQAKILNHLKITRRND